MLDKKRQKEILDNTFAYNRLHDIDKISDFEKDKTKTLIIAALVSFVAIIAIYLVSPYSKTFRISVDGNIYLSEEDILEEANVSKYFLLTKPSAVKRKLEKNPLVESAEVNMKDGRIVEITVKEVKAIGYIIEDNTCKLLLVDGNKIELNDDNIYLIEKVPLIEGYTTEELDQIRNGFVNVDYKIINEISEIHKYPVSYDSLYMEAIMIDGNIAFLSYYDIDTLEDYYGVSSGIDKTKGYACIYFDGQTNSATASACPWQEVSKTVEEENTTESVEEESN